MDRTPYVDIDALKSVLNVKAEGRDAPRRSLLRSPRPMRSTARATATSTPVADRRRRGALLHARPAAHAADRRRARDPRARDRPGPDAAFTTVWEEDRDFTLEPLNAPRRRAARSSASRCIRSRDSCSIPMPAQRPHHRDLRVARGAAVRSSKMCDDPRGEALQAARRAVRRRIVRQQRSPCRVLRDDPDFPLLMQGLLRDPIVYG
jgi:hypothetical protein